MNVPLVCTLFGGKEASYFASCVARKHNYELIRKPVCSASLYRQPPVACLWPLSSQEERVTGKLEEQQQEVNIRPELKGE